MGAKPINENLKQKIALIKQKAQMQQREALSPPSQLTPLSQEPLPAPVPVEVDYDSARAERMDDSEEKVAEEPTFVDPSAIEAEAMETPEMQELYEKFNKERERLLEKRKQPTPQLPSQPVPQEEVHPVEETAIQEESMPEEEQTDKDSAYEEQREALLSAITAYRDDGVFRVDLIRQLAELNHTLKLLLENKERKNGTIEA